MICGDRDLCAVNVFHFKREPQLVYNNSFQGMEFDRRRIEDGFQMMAEVRPLPQPLRLSRLSF